MVSVFSKVHPENHRIQIQLPPPPSSTAPPTARPAQCLLELTFVVIFVVVRNVCGGSRARERAPVHYTKGPSVAITLLEVTEHGEVQGVALRAEAAVVAHTLASLRVRGDVGMGTERLRETASEVQVPGIYVAGPRT